MALVVRSTGSNTYRCGDREAGRLGARNRTQRRRQQDQGIALEPDIAVHEEVRLDLLGPFRCDDIVDIDVPGVRLVGKKSNPDAIGAKITWQAEDLKRSKLKVGGGSYLSSHDPREVLGIGKQKKIDKLEIRWPQPSGRTETFTDLPIDRYITIVEGSGIK